MPNKIQTIQALVATENDPSSPMWPGHVHSAAMQPVQMQPGAADPTIKVTMPNDILRAKAVKADSISDAMDDDPEKGVRVGPHWFEVVPTNSIQSRLISFSLK